MRKKKQEASQHTGFGGDPLSPRLSPEDVQQKEFRLAFRGYNERDVDAFLDHVTEEVGAYQEEARRLRGELEAARGADAGLGNDAAAGQARADAEGILAGARREAERIVAEARSEAARIAAAAAGGGAGADARAVMAPFLARERGFLQELGQLVQQHAEAVRQMVQAARDGHGAEGPDAGSQEQSTTREGTGPDQPVSVPEAEPDAAVGAAAEGSDEPGTEPPSEAEGGRSLRDLFWGED
ncbi:MAG TPA: DivIVA domain-containing protein [Actinomycetota bacterium]|jgi:DivIVA domain-containing protein|nr:DivIVA domain-containing protein [Actinomycetota bacterium]